MSWRETITGFLCCASDRDRKQKLNKIAYVYFVIRMKIIRKYTCGSIIKPPLSLLSTIQLFTFRLRHSVRWLAVQTTAIKHPNNIAKIDDKRMQKATFKGSN